jgi:hypothetical protein
MMQSGGSNPTIEDMHGGDPSTDNDTEASEEAGPSKSGAPGRRQLRPKQDNQYNTSDEEDFEEPSSPDAEDAEDHNDTECKVCGSEDNPEKLLCCESCPAVYHLYCLDPPLSRIPAGDWFCPACTRTFSLQEIERILDVRQQQQKVAAAGAEAKPGGTSAAATPSRKQPSSAPQGGTEYFVKFKGRSYLHCEWVSEASFDAAAKQFPALKTRLRKFHTLQQQGGPLPEQAEPGEEAEEWEHGVNPLWRQVRPPAQRQRPPPRFFPKNA